MPGLGGTGLDLISDTSAAVDELAKTRLFESILTFVTTLAQRSPLVLVFEDLQWADSASANLLDFLSRNLRDARGLLIGTYRDEEVSSTPVRLTARWPKRSTSRS